MAQYFTAQTDVALDRFISSVDDKERHDVFDKSIRPAFEKLIESLIFVYGFHRLDDVDTLQRECLSNLYEMIPKFDPKKGTKGFSYFNVVAKNWFIHKTRERSKRNRTESELYVDLDHELVKRDPNTIVSPHEEFIEERERWSKFYDAMNSWRDRLDKKTEVQVLEAIIFLMKNADLVTIYNRKAVQLYIRDMTHLNTKQVATNMKKIKVLYDEWLEGYISTGV